MRIGELAKLLGKSRTEVQEMLSGTDVIELNLNEKQGKYREGKGEPGIFE